MYKKRNNGGVRSVSVQHANGRVALRYAPSNGREVVEPPRLSIRSGHDPHHIYQPPLFRRSVQWHSNVETFRKRLLCNEDNNTPTGAGSAFMASTSQSGGSGRVAVDFEVIGRRSEQRVLESNVRERFGKDTVKVIRILLDKGKMDEKHLAKVSLTAANVLRPLLTRLSTASLVSLQEVPKSADRNPSRTFYLCSRYVDLAKAYSNLLSALYQALANIIARNWDEQEKVRPVFDKQDRSDANGDERLLGRGEIAALREWEGKQERLNVLALRMF